MKIRTSASALVHHAYRLLKQDTYYDKMNLFRRARIADYEAGGRFNDRQILLSELVDDLRKGKPSQKSQQTIQMWLDNIYYRLLPKSVEDTNQKSLRNSQDIDTPRLISNVRTAEKYFINKDGGVQYFIDAPVELYILSTIWCMIVGPELDRILDEGCFGNRLDRESDESSDEGSSKLFKIFHHQYAKWRNTAIDRAKELLEQGTSAVILSLDIKQCFYRLSVDWQRVPVRQNRGFRNLSRNLTSILKKIHISYRTIISESLAQTHDIHDSTPEGIPIGLPSSRVLANWLLNPFDQAVRENLQPSYFGRYVDDILIVAQAPAIQIVKAGSEAILKNLLIDKELLHPRKDKQGKTEYSLCCPSSLIIQSSKLIIQHFDKHHSRAGLSEFIKEIQKDASDFRFLPADDRGRELDACAFDIIYEGSINKLRSVIGIKENSTELSKYLARRMVEHRLTSEFLQKEVTEQLDRFSRGKNLLDFCTTWERILTLLIVKGQHTKAELVLLRCLQTINKIESELNSGQWVQKTRADLTSYLSIALGMVLALLKMEWKDSIKSKKLKNLISDRFPDVTKYAFAFRVSNLLRHQWVAWPLLNYTQYRGSLVEFDIPSLQECRKWDIESSENQTPRYIHNDERMLFKLLHSLVSPVEAEFSLFFGETESTIDVNTPRLVNRNIHGESKDELSIGIANMKVNEIDISSSYSPLSKPNTSWERQSKLFELLNLAEEEQCDMLVLPEVSVPYSWLPFMVSHARRAQIALVFGLEHWVCGKTAYNLLVTVLPYKENDLYRACKVFIRPKNHYSPAENAELNRLDLAAPNLDPAYFLFAWRDVYFTVFNCFELSDIKHRAKFRANIDFLIAVEWNKDTKYFSNIVESTVRDLHCYVIQVNTSQYGDSRITLPVKSDEMNVVRVSGGENTTLLKARINIRELNDFRCRKPSPVDGRYKPTSAGFEHESIRNRGTQN